MGSAQESDGPPILVVLWKADLGFVHSGQGSRVCGSQCQQGFREVPALLGASRVLPRPVRPQFFAAGHTGGNAYSVAGGRVAVREIKRSAPRKEALRKEQLPINPHRMKPFRGFDRLARCGRDAVLVRGIRRLRQAVGLPLCRQAEVPGP